MKKWATFLITLMLCSIALGQNLNDKTWPSPPARACQYVIHSSCGCILIGLTSGSGYCSHKILELCTDCGGACAVAFSGNCQPPTYCGPAEKVTNLKARLSRPENKWIGKKFLAEVVAVNSFYVAKALRALQETLQAEDVTTEAWEHTTLVMGARKVDGRDPYTAELSSANGEWTMTVIRHDESDKEYGTKWTMHMNADGWSLESTEGDHASGTF